MIKNLSTIFLKMRKMVIFVSAATFRQPHRNDEAKLSFESLHFL